MIVSTYIIAKKSTSEIIYQFLGELNDGFIIPSDDYDETKERKCPACDRWDWLGHKKDCKFKATIDFLDELQASISVLTMEEWAQIEDALFGSAKHPMGRW